MPVRATPYGSREGRRDSRWAPSGASCDGRLLGGTEMCRQRQGPRRREVAMRLPGGRIQRLLPDATRRPDAPSPNEGTAMKLAKRVESLPPYLFAEISKKIAAKRAAGHDVVTFAIGDPDLPTPPHILEALHRAADEPGNHRYPESEGLPELRQSIADWYERRFEVKFDPQKECLPLIG